MNVRVDVVVRQVRQGGDSRIRVLSADVNFVADVCVADGWGYFRDCIHKK